MLRSALLAAVLVWPAAAIAAEPGVGTAPPAWAGALRAPPPSPSVFEALSPVSAAQAQTSAAPSRADAGAAAPTAPGPPPGYIDEMDGFRRMRDPPDAAANAEDGKEDQP